MWTVEGLLLLLLLLLLPVVFSVVLFPEDDKLPTFVRGLTFFLAVAKRDIWKDFHVLELLLLAFYNVLVLSVLEFVLSQCFLFLSVLALQKLKMNCRPQLLFSCVRAFETLENPENRDSPQKTDIFAEKPPPSYPNSLFFAPCSKNISHGKE